MSFNCFISGVIDTDTVRMMETPRCGIPDGMSGTSEARQKRYAAWDGRLN